MNVHKPLAECNREEALERLRRSADRHSAKETQIRALQKKIVDERSGRRQANRERDEAVAELKRVREALGVVMGSPKQED